MRQYLAQAHISKCCSCINNPSVKSLIFQYPTTKNNLRIEGFHRSFICIRAFSPEFLFKFFICEIKKPA